MSDEINPQSKQSKMGRPRKPEDELRTKNKYTFYSSDKDLKALGLSNHEFKPFLEALIATEIKAKSEGE